MTPGLARAACLQELASTGSWWDQISGAVLRLPPPIVTAQFLVRQEA
jgi:hypothetical protein